MFRADTRRRRPNFLAAWVVQSFISTTVHSGNERWQTARILPKNSNKTFAQQFEHSKQVVPTEADWNIPLQERV